MAEKFMVDTVAWWLNMQKQARVLDTDNQTGFISGDGGDAAITEFDELFSYSKDDVILYQGSFYEANDDIPAGTPFTLGTTGATWRAMVEGNGIYDFDPTKSYKQFDTVYHNGNIQRAVVDVPAGTGFIDSEWQIISSGVNGTDVGNLPDWVAESTYSRNQVVVHNDLVYRATQDHTASTSFDLDHLTNGYWDLVNAKSNVVCPHDWEPNSEYEEGEIVFYNDSIYRSTEQHISGSTFESDQALGKWSSLVAEISYLHIDPWTANTDYISGRVVNVDRIIYRALSDFTSATTWELDKANWEQISNPMPAVLKWLPDTTYAAGDPVWYSGNFYTAKSNHTSGSSFDATNWTDYLAPVQNAIVPWKTSTAYTTGTILFSGQDIVRVLSDHTSGNFYTDLAAEKLRIINSGSRYSKLSSWQSNVRYPSGVLLTDDNLNLWRGAASFISGGTIAEDIANGYLVKVVDYDLRPYALDWESGKDYLENEMVVDNGIIYRAADDHTSAATFAADLAASHWTPLSKDDTTEMLSDWEQNTEYVDNQIVLNMRVIYRATQDHTSTSNFTTDFNNGRWMAIGERSHFRGLFGYTNMYVINDYIMYKGNILRTTSNMTGRMADNTDSVVVDRPNLTIPDFSEFSEANKDVIFANTLVFHGNLIYKANKNVITFSDDPTVNTDDFDVYMRDIFKGTYVEALDYPQGSVVIRGMRLYSANSDIVGGTAWVVGNTINQWSELAPPQGAAIPNWTATVEYTANEIVVQGGKIYRCTIDHTAGALFDAIEQANWDALSVGAMVTVESYAENKNFVRYALCVFEAKLYRALVDIPSAPATFDPDDWEVLSSSVAVVPNYVENAAYVTRAIVYHDNRLYRATEDIDPAPAVFDATKWEELNQVANMRQLINDEVYYENELVVETVGNVQTIYRVTTTATYETTSRLDFLKDNAVSLSVGYANPIKNDITALVDYPGPIPTGTLFVYQGKWRRTTSALVPPHNASDLVTNSEQESSFYNTFLTPEWTGLTDYLAGEMVRKGDKLYVASQDHTSTPTFENDVDANWIVITSRQPMFMGNYNPTTGVYLEGDTVNNNMVTYLVIADIDAGTSWSDALSNNQVSRLAIYPPNISDFSDSQAYRVNDIIIDPDTGRAYTVKSAVTGAANIGAVTRSAYAVEGKVVDYTSGSHYAPNQIVRHQNALWVNNGTEYTNAPATFNESHWDKIAIDRAVAPDWTDDKEYILDEMAVQNGKLYRCITAYTAASGEAFADNEANWETIGGGLDLPDWAASTDYKALESFVIRSNTLYRCLTDHTSSANFITDKNAGYWANISTPSEDETTVTVSGIYDQFSSPSDTATNPTFVIDGSDTRITFSPTNLTIEKLSSVWINGWDVTLDCTLVNSTSVSYNGTISVDDSIAIYIVAAA